MKIVCISASRIPSSTANSIQVMKACQALAQQGHHVRLLIPGNRSYAWESMAEHYGLQTAFPVEWLPAQASLRRYDFAFSAVRRACQLDADIVYAWPLQAALIALWRHLPVLLELHGPPEGKLGPWLFRSFLAYPGSKRLLPITQALVAVLQRQYPGKINPMELVVVPNGVDLERYQGLPRPEEARLRVGLPDLLTVGYTGHLYPGRGMNLLLELARRFPTLQFLWVGGRNKELVHWRDQISRMNLTNISLLGFVDNSRLPLYQAAADILLMPYEQVITGSSGGNSVEYCSPMKMFEYMACGRPIISSDLPVIREVLDERSAILCPPEDVIHWEQALRSLVADPVRRDSLGKAVQDKVQTLTWQQRARNALAGFDLS